MRWLRERVNRMRVIDPTSPREIAERFANRSVEPCYCGLSERLTGIGTWFRA
jgi:hypothetical protein